MDNTSDSTGRTGNVRSLESAIRRVRTAEAERSDVVVELRDAERARLEMLVDALRGVLAEIPEGNDSLMVSLAAGVPARLWVDMTGFVVMGRDRRTYRFLKDTRLGRTIILETADVDAMADCVTDYIAERIVERERAIEADWVVQRGREPTTLPRREARVRSLESPTPTSPTAQTPDRRSHGWIAAAFLLGVLIGVAGLFAYAWLRVPFS
ncbi:hypothetical protein [Bauldia sp.]|uniref:hypothetical protein n=1 Tax=Bauldia sp. TaxID=2575872 RepID=UPI003BAA2C93